MEREKITPKNILHHELTGLFLEVVYSANHSQQGFSGTVVDETRQTLTIDTGHGEKNLAKDQCIFLFTLPSGERVRVEGSLLVARPEDRIKKRPAKW